MIMRSCIAAAALALAFGGGAPAFADSISETEHARAQERAGRYLTDQDVTLLERYGGNDDGFYSGYGYRDPYHDEEPYDGPVRYRRHRYNHYDD